MRTISQEQSLENAFLAACRENPNDPTHYLVYADWLAEQERTWDELWARARAWVIARELRGCPLNRMIERNWHALNGYWLLIWGPYRGYLTLQFRTLFNEWLTTWEYIPPTNPRTLTNHPSTHPAEAWAWVWTNRRNQRSAQPSTRRVLTPDVEASEAATDFYQRLLKWRRKANPKLW